MAFVHQQLGGVAARDDVVNRDGQLSSRHEQNTESSGRKDHV